MPSPSSAADRAVAALDGAVAAKPGGTRRDGQRRMTAAVAQAIADRSHLLVEAGTGTGKSLGYLVPALVSGKRLVVSTATKALQNQIAGVDLPFLAEHLGRDFTWAVIKGRQSYACMAKLVERFGSHLDGAPQEPGLFDDDATEDLAAVAAWASDDPWGDRDDLAPPVGDETWRLASVSGMECPGASRCPQGDRCFADAAFDRAMSADVIVTNHHLYGAHLATGGRVLPEHDLAVFDEAHRLEGALSGAFGVSISAGRLGSLAGVARHAMAPGARRDGRDLVADLHKAGEALGTRLAAVPEGRVDPSTGDLGAALAAAERAVGAAVRRMVQADEAGSRRGLALRARQQGGHLAGDISLALDMPGGYVAWVETDRRPVLRVAPIEVGNLLADALLGRVPVVMTSATLTVAGSFASQAGRLGFVAEGPGADEGRDADDGDALPRTYRGLIEPGGFDYPRQGLLYVAAGLPDPRTDGYRAAAIAEIRSLTAASGGRALVLTTSRSMMAAAAAALAGSPWRVLVQDALPRARLLAEFADDETSTLVATMGYWEGIDVPGPSLSLVIIDKLPFPRPDEPLASARREALAARGSDPFMGYDLPQAALGLAQGAGRLIRNESDRGVVAVLDSRLSSRRYGWHILRSLPRLRVTRDGEQARRFLAAMAGQG